MKTKMMIAFGGLAALFLAHCGTASKVAIRAPEPNAVMAKTAGHSLESLGNGYTIYLRKCAECHEHRVPTMLLPAEQHSLVSGMSFNAGLSKTEEKDLQNYLDAISDR
jgi:cytochrome c5